MQNSIMVYFSQNKHSKHEKIKNVSNVTLWPISTKMRLHTTIEGLAAHHISHSCSTQTLNLSLGSFDMVEF